MVVTRYRVCYGRMFKTQRGVTQEEPVSPTIFNVVADLVVRPIMMEVCGPQESQHGLGWATG